MRETSARSALRYTGPMPDDLPADVQQALDKAPPVGKYVPVAKLGSGGMGEVWKAWDRELSRWVALKLLLPGRSDDDLLRFQREAQAVARLSHPNIAPVYDAAEVDGRRYIAMQFVDGDTLSDTSLPLRKACEAVRDAARAVHFAHEHGVIHRDIKPSNLIVDRAGRAFVLDFGIARSTRSEGTISKTGIVVGTPPYMSPEQASGDRALGARSDVYSLGATLYALATGREPFAGKTATAVLLKVIHHEPAPPREVRRDLPRDVETILLKAMEKDPARRYATASALAEDLRRFLDGEPILAHPPSVWYRLTKRIAKRRAVVGAVAATALAAAFGTVVLLLVLRTGAWEEACRSARLAHDAKDWPRALAECERALQMRHDKAIAALADECRVKIAADRRERERTTRRKELLERLRPLEGLIKETRPTFYIKGVDIRQKLRRVEMALADLERIVQDPENAEFGEPWLSIGAGWYLVGDDGRAELALRKAEPRMPDDPTLHWHLGRIFLHRSIYARMSDQTAGDPGWIQRSADLGRTALGHMRRVTKAGGELIEQQIAEAYVAFLEERYQDAIRLCEEGLRRFAGEMGSEEFLNVIAFADRRAPLIRIFSDALKLRPHYAWGSFIRGTELIAAGRPDQAIEDLNDAIRVNPRMDAAWNNRGLARTAAGDPAGAVDDLTEALRLRPAYPGAHFNRGQAFKALGEWDRALEDYDRAIKIRPMADCLAMRGSVKLHKRDYAGALADLDEAVRLDPRDPITWASRATAREANLDIRGAIADLEEALKAAPPDWKYRAKANDHMKVLRAKLGE